MPDGVVARAPGCSVTEEAKRRIAVLRVRGDVPRLPDAAFPVFPNTAVGDEPRVLWLAPGEWMIVGGAERWPDLRDAVSGRTAHVVDVGDGRTCFRVAGIRSRDLLGKGTSLDLHPRVFGHGTCARTLFAGTQVLIDRNLAEDAFDLYADISFATHLRRWFADALVEFEGEAG